MWLKSSFHTGYYWWSLNHWKTITAVHTSSFVIHFELILFPVWVFCEVPVVWSLSGVFLRLERKSFSPGFPLFHNYKLSPSFPIGKGKTWRLFWKYPFKIFTLFLSLSMPFEIFLLNWLLIDCKPPPSLQLFLPLSYTSKAKWS